MQLDLKKASEPCGIGLIWINGRKTPDNSSCDSVATVSLAALHKKLTQKKEGDVLEDTFFLSP